MRKHDRLPILFLTLALLTNAGGSAKSQDQAGGGRLPGDAAGGAAIIFRRPSNPTVHTASDSSRSTAGGGTVSGRGRTRTPVVAEKVTVQDRIIMKANAARSAPKPRYTEAETEYKRAGEQEPSDARAHAGLGNVYLDQGRYAEAVAAYRQAIKVKIDYIDAYQPLGFSLIQLKKYDEAADIMMQALKYDAGNAELYNNLGYAYVQAERYNEAVDVCLKALELLGQTGSAYRQGLQNRDEVLSHAYKNLGNAYNGLKKYNQAADVLKRATQIEPTNAAAHFNLGLALYNGGRYSEAIEAYKAVTKLRPQLAAAHYNLGLTYVAVNDKDSARREYDILKPLNADMANQLHSVIR